MKKIIAIISVLCLFSIFQAKNIYAKTTSILTRENKINITNLYDLNASFEKPTKDVDILDNISTDIKNSVEIHGYVKKKEIVNNRIIYLYTLYGKSYLLQYIINEETNEFEDVYKVELDFLANDFTICNDNIYVCGMAEGDGIIEIYNQELEYIYKYQINGDGLEEIIKINFYKNYFYLYIYKNGISTNSIFKNVGNNNEFKSIIEKFDCEFNLINTLYINKQDKNEKVQDLYFYNDEISFLLKTSCNVYYYYKIDYNLDIIETYVVDMYDEMYLVDNMLVNDTKLYIAKSNKTLYYVVIDDYGYFEYEIYDNIDTIYYYEINKDTLNIYILQDKKVKKIELFEYHYKKLYDKQITFASKNYQDSDYFMAKSYFFDIAFTYDYEKNKNIDLKQSGVNKLYYSYNNEYTIEFEVEIMPYINIIDYGIYEAPYLLEYTDDAYLNEKKIHNGTILEENGEYVIKHKGRKYHILVVDNYYKKITNSSSMCINASDKIQIQLELTNNKEILSTYIDDVEVPFIQSDTCLILEIDAKNSNQVLSYKTITINYSDDTKKVLSYDIDVVVKKRIPIIDVTYENEKIIYDVIDDDKAIISLVLEYYKDETFINRIYVTDENKEIYQDKNANKIILKMLYELGDGKTYDMNLLELSYKDMNSSSMCLLNQTYSLNGFEKIELSNFVKDQNISSSINDLDTTNLFVESSNYSFLIISIIISISSFVAIVVYLVYKKKKIAK